MRRFSRLLVSCLAFLGAIVAPASAGDPLKGLPKNPSSFDVLNHLLKLGPAERMLLLDKLPAEGRVTIPVTRGPLVQTIIERGTLQAVQSSAVHCTIKPTAKGSTVATTIRWIVDEGALVKKGDKLIEFDDTVLLERIKQQKTLVSQTESELMKASHQLAGIDKETQLDVKLADVDVRLAGLMLRQYKGADAIEKAILELKVDRANLLLERTRASAAMREKQAAVERDVKKAIHLQELERLRELEAERAKHVHHAAQDGLVVYPEQGRFGGGQAVVAVGEPVREGQKVMSISDLKRFAVITRVHEASIARVQAGQKADIRVDAFPGRTLTGTVQDIATVASQADFFSNDVKVYPVNIPLDGEPKDLRPGMSAEVTLITGARTDALRLPTPAILKQGKEHYCYVLIDKKLEMRKIQVGLRTDRFVEILGLKEQEVVLANPHAVAERIADSLNDGKRAAPGRLKPTQLRLRSVKPADDAGARAFVSRYGLLAEDFERIAALPAVAAIVPVRSFPQDVDSRVSLIVATTSDYAAEVSLTLATGRFLVPADDDEGRNVAVLGAEIASELFKSQNPVGESIMLNKHPYVIVGVLRKRLADEAASWKLDHTVYIPLRTARQRFGERIYIRQGGSRRAEQVQFTEILVTLRDVADVPAAARAISALLRENHLRNDWAIDVGQ